MSKAPTTLGNRHLWAVPGVSVGPGAGLLPEEASGFTDFPPPSLPPGGLLRVQATRAPATASPASLQSAHSPPPPLEHPKDAPHSSPTHELRPPVPFWVLFGALQGSPLCPRGARLPHRPDRHHCVWTALSVSVTHLGRAQNQPAGWEAEKRLWRGGGGVPAATFPPGGAERAAPEGQALRRVGVVAEAARSWTWREPSRRTLEGSRAWARVPGHSIFLP